MSVEQQTEAVPRCGVAVMAKASIPGRAKTRLVPPLDHDEAAAFNTVFLKDVFANIRAAAGRASIGSYAAGGPAGSEEFFQGILPPEAQYFECWVGHFGDCLRHAAWHLFDRGSQERGRPQRRQPDLADRAVGPDRRPPRLAGRPGGARPIRRRRLLPAGVEAQARADVPGHRLEHRAGGCPDHRASRGTGPAGPRAADVVRRRRCGDVAPAARRVVRRPPLPAAVCRRTMPFTPPS